MGKPTSGNALVSHNEYIVMRMKPSELKHLSNWRKRKKTIDSVSSGERKRI